MNELIAQARELTTDEIIKALRVCNNPKGHRCSECPILGRYEHGCCKRAVDRLAADALEAAIADIKQFANQTCEYGCWACKKSENGSRCRTTCNGFEWRGLERS